MIQSISLWTPGTPQPQGSIAYKGMSGKGKPILTSDNANLKPWRVQLCWAIKTAWLHGPGKTLRGPLLSAVSLQAAFYFPRPRYHYRNDGSIKPMFVSEPKITKPDLDKLLRAVCDAMKDAGVIQNDAQVVRFEEGTGKFYVGPQAEGGVFNRGASPGVELRISWDG